MTKRSGLKKYNAAAAGTASRISHNHSANRRIRQASPIIGKTEGDNKIK
jgi:hypothetical protein